VLLTAPRPVTFLGGKGGVGKTTLAAATALAAARAGQRTLVVSTDPAHSLGDVLDTSLDGEVREVAPRLFAAEIDAEAAAAAHVDDVEERMSGTLDPDLLPAIRRHLAIARTAPGTLESALFDVMTRFMDDCPARFDRVVFDTAPTGHTLRLLTLPALLSAWVEGLARQREKVAGLDRMFRNMAGDDRPDSDPVMAALHERRARFERAAGRLEHDAAFWLVLLPERLPIEETARAETALGAQGLHIGGLIVNQRLPDDAEDRFLRARREQQRSYEAEIERRFPDRAIVTVEQRPRDIRGVDELATIAASLPSPLTGGGPADAGAADVGQA
jgi:arsenite/tail-anchored protein-transporting ATPase